MTQNGIRPEGITELISNGLSNCTNLELFDLQDNTFTIKGAQALAMAVPEWSALKELGVGDDLLGARGCIKVFEALAKKGNKNVEVETAQHVSGERRLLRLPVKWHSMRPRRGRCW